MRKKTFTIIFVVMSLVFVSGCGMGTAIRKWSDGVGAIMPTYKGKSCDSRYFCFGGKGNMSRALIKKEKLESEAREAEMIARRKINQTRRAEPHARRAAQQRNTPRGGYQSPQQQQNKPQKPLYYEKPAKEGEIPPPPPFGSEHNSYSKQIPDAYNPRKNPQRAVPNNYPADQQMKPWEENPEWKKDLPPSPTQGLEKSLGW